MSFDEWYATQKHQLSNETLCRQIWEIAQANYKCETDGMVLVPEEWVDKRYIELLNSI